MKSVIVKLPMKYPWYLWHWTNGSESLFDLNAEELFMFSQFVDYANGKKIV